MITVRTASELTAALEPHRQEGVSFVPTMGALHDGHVSLVRAASTNPGVVVASVFVNPTQFAPGEDFERYPRNEGRDAILLAENGCDILFAPEMDVIYPPGFATSVTVDPRLTAILCGSVRGESHFAGVSTVVARLFGLVNPRWAYFGEKDWQQVAVIRAMTADIFPSVEIKTGRTIRDTDGLALSSRNAYLKDEERALAATIPQCLSAISNATAAGERNPHVLVDIGTAILDAAGLKPEYLEIRNGRTLRNDEEIDHDSRVFIAVQIGSTRLIDNASLVDGHQDIDETSHPSSSTASPASTANAAATVR